MTEFIEWLKSGTAGWAPTTFKILLIVVVTAAIWTLLRLVLGSLNRRMQTNKDETGRKARTTLAIVRVVVGILVFTLAGFMILTELGMKLGPILATAGVAGIALGLGAQSLVKDSMNGFFLMIENRIRVGDFVEAAGKEGTVEAITLLDLVLRDMRGRVHIIPHGNIDVATNSTLTYSVALVDIGTAYKDDARKVLALLQDIADKMRAEPDWQDKMTDEPKVFGITSFGDSSLNFRVRVQTPSGEHWAVERELRLRIKERFDAEGIEIPFPHRTLYWGDTQAPETRKLN